MNEEIKQLLNEVDTLKIQLSALRPLPEEALKKIQDALDIEYTYESNRIEGNTLTLQETALVVNEGVSEHTIKEIHALILHGIDRENAGKYRTVPVMISGSTHMPPQPYLIEKQMEDFIIKQ